MELCLKTGAARPAAIDLRKAYRPVLSFSALACRAIERWYALLADLGASVTQQTRAIRPECCQSDSTRA